MLIILGIITTETLLNSISAILSLGIVARYPVTLPLAVVIVIGKFNLRSSFFAKYLDIQTFVAPVSIRNSIC